VAQDGASHHGSLQERWLTTSEACDDGARALPKGGEAQATKWVGDELETPEADGFAEGQTFTR
jgi:hypothetical protein